jgi:hypothetical protein
MTVPKYINSYISDVNIGFFEFQAAALAPVWQNTPVEPDGTIKPNPPVTKKRDYIVLRAEMDLVVCLSAGHYFYLREKTAQCAF